MIAWRARATLTLKKGSSQFGALMGRGGGGGGSTGNANFKGRQME